MVPPISIGVFAAPDIKESLVNRILDEAEAIWGRTAITFDAHRITSADVGRAWQLSVTIDDRRHGSVEEGHADLGWIPFTLGRPSPSIHLSRTGAEALIRRTGDVSNMTALTHEILLGRALGRALSHELGHYLLKSKVHTQQGLMRAIWPSDQLLSVDRRGFELTAEQGAVAERFQEGELTTVSWKSSPAS